MIATGMLLSLFAWLWSVWRGFGVGIICGLLNFFFPPLSQIIFSLYEKRLRAPLLLMLLGSVLTTWGLWHHIRYILDHHELPPGGIMVQRGAPAAPLLTARLASR